MCVLKAAVSASLLLFAGLSTAHASIIQVNYTGTYSGTIISGDPAISQFTTTTVGPTAFNVTFTFDTKAGFYSETAAGSSLGGFNVGNVSGTFGTLNANNPNSVDRASPGETSQTIVDVVYSKVISYPSLSISVSNPGIPGSILEPFSISSGLVGSGYYNYSSSGNFYSIRESFQLIPETISVTVDGISAAVPEPSTWAMMLIGFIGFGFFTYRRRNTGSRIAPLPVPCL